MVNNLLGTHPRHRHLTCGERDQQNAKRIDIIGNAALSTPTGMAHGTVGRLEDGSLQGAGWGSPCPTQHDGCALPRLEDVAGANGAVGEACLMQPVQRNRRRTQQIVQQCTLTPRRDRQ